MSHPAPPVHQGPVIKEPVPLYSRAATVVSVRDLSPRMRRVVVRAESIGENFPWFAMSPTDHVKVVVPGADGVLRVPEVKDDRLALDELPERPIIRDYTVRAVDYATCSLTLDFVVHAHGPAGRWAAQAAEGHQIGILGPRGTKRFPVGYDHYVLGADETALPAMCRFIEEAPEGSRLTVFVTVADLDGVIALPRRDSLDVRWFDQSRGEQLAISDLDSVALSDAFVWLAGEAGDLKPLRGHLIRELGLPRDRVQVEGYWRRGAEAYDHHQPIDTDDDAEDF